MPIYLKFAIIIIASYTIGNINFAILISKFKKKDIRNQGSGNPGTMNMTRTFGAKIGILTMILDMLKGVVSAMLGYFLLQHNSLQAVGLYTGGFSAIVGHIFPVIFKFKGGKGVATTLGVFLFAQPIYFWIFFAVGFINLLLFEFGSVASLFIVAGCVCIESFHNQGNLPVLLLLYTIFLLIWWAHRQNIYKLLIGKENKVKLIKKKQYTNYKKNIKKAE